MIAAYQLGYGVAFGAGPLQNADRRRAAPPTGLTPRCEPIPSAVDGVRLGDGGAELGLEVCG